MPEYSDVPHANLDERILVDLGTPLIDVIAEMAAQDFRWGQQNHPDGTSNDAYGVLATMCRHITNLAARAGTLTWRHILDEEVQEALSEEDPAKLRAELVQVAAVALQWVSSIDRRETEGASE